MYLSLIHIFISFTQDWHSQNSFRWSPTAPSSTWIVQVLSTEWTSEAKRNKIGVASWHYIHVSHLLPHYRKILPFLSLRKKKRCCKIKIKCQSQQQITYLVPFCTSVDWQPGALVAYKGKKSGVHFKLKCLTDVTAFCNKTDEISNSKVHLLYSRQIKFQQATFPVLSRCRFNLGVWVLFVCLVLFVWVFCCFCFLFIWQ